MITLFPHQQSIKDRYNLCLFWDAGCGKTYGALSWAENKIQDNHILILCPASIINQWHISCKEYYPELKIKIIKGTERDYSNANIYITSYETFKRDYQSKFDITFLNRTILIADEASKFKNNKTCIYKMMKYLSTKVKWKIALTATPLETKAFDIYNICSFINSNWISYHTFSTRYVQWEEVWTGKETINVPGKLKNIEELRERIKLISDRIKKEDVRKDLPSLSITWREVEPSKEQIRIKKQLIKDNENFFEIATLLKSLDNGVNELLESDSDKVSSLCITPEKPAKLKVIEEVLSEIGGQQILIFTQFTRTANIIYEELKDKYSCELVCGGDNEKDDKVQRFKDNQYQILISTDTLAYGVSFDDVDVVLNVDLPYNPSKLHQRTQRIHRINSQRGKLCINLVGGIIDCDVYEVLKERDGEFMFLIDGIGKTLSDINLMQEIAKKYGKKG